MSPAAIVLIVIVLGATVYLRRAKYIRRKTTYVIVGFLVLVLLFMGYTTYRQN